MQNHHSCLISILGAALKHFPCFQLIPAVGLFMLVAFSLPAQEHAFVPFPGQPGQSQKYPVVEQFTISDGLSDNTVNACLQDRMGYLWLGTNNGLNRYDGYTFTVYKHQPGNPASISNNKINALQEDRAGRLWIATDGGLNCFDPRTEAFRSYQHRPGDPGSLSHNQANALLESPAGTLWVGTSNGLNRFDESQQLFHSYWHQSTHRNPWDKEPSHHISTLSATAGGAVLVGYAGMGLMRFDPQTETFQQAMVKNSNTGPGLNLRAIAPPQEGKNWVVASEQLYQYEDGSLRLAGELPSAITELNGFRPTPSGRILVPSWEGLYLLDKNYQPLSHFLPEGPEPVSPLHNWVRGPIEDRAGDLWFGSSGAGLFRLTTTGNHFTNYHYQPGEANSIPHPHVNALLEVSEKEVWVGTRRHGLKIFNPQDNSFRPAPGWIQPPNGLNTPELSAFFQDSKGNIWIGTWGGGINFYRPATKTFDYFLNDRTDSTTLPDNFVNAIMETAEREIWVASTLGISVFPNEEAIRQGRFRNYRYSPQEAGSLNHPCATALLQTRDGRVWAGTRNGLHLFDREKDNFILYQQDLQSPNSLANNSINTLFEDSQGRLWIGTAGGLEKYEPQTNSFTHYLEAEGLADGHIAGIREDQQGYLWITTKTGISRFCPETGEFKNYGAKDGLLNHSFISNAFIRSKDKSTFYAGGKNGLSLFHPGQIRENTYVPPVLISSLKAYHMEGGKTTEAIIKGVAHRKEIRLSYQDNIIIFELTALNFRNAKKNQYAYQLEGFNDAWVNVGNKREITFTNLRPGQYTLRVRGSNNDGLWNEADTALRIAIAPPWWQTGWAYLAYTLLTFGLLALAYRFLLRRQQLRQQLLMGQREAQRLKELDTFKSRLYTNLTHEFRTPLTVILGMAKQLSAGGWQSAVPKKEQSRISNGLKLIRNNGQSLLGLINQLLDLAKLENHSLQLKYQQGDIVPYLRYLTESFQTYANSHNIALRFSTTLESLIMDFDPEQAKQIMANLLSNALKFTPSGGEVSVNAAEGEEKGAEGHVAPFLLLTVEDTGIGIGGKDLPHIFSRFYQADNSATRRGEGTGIGLAHTQELVKLMEGKIEVESKMGEGTKFTVSLPVSRKAGELIDARDKYPTASKVSAMAPAERASTAAEGQPRLLLIEDNPDVVAYLKSCLEGLYELDVAYNGRIGIEKALKNIPDLIISDVMMPEKDGFQVCDTLKNDERSSHIPIILLTAKADTPSRIDGLRRGADAYLAKPFDKEELLVRLEKLVERQKRMAAHFSQNLDTTSSNLATPPPPQEEALQIEDAFLRKVRGIVEANHSDEHFALPQLCREIGMSRSQLYRKMKAIADISPSDFIRSYRLNRAKALLEKGELNVSEVAWEVGYKDLAHFSRSFQEAFGTSPSEINNSLA